MWSVASVLTGLLSFMLDTTPTTGSIETTVEEKKQIAVESGEKLLQNPHYCNLFPDLPSYQAKQKQRLLELKKKKEEEKTVGVNGGDVSESTAEKKMDDKSEDGPKESEIILLGHKGTRIKEDTGAGLEACIGEPSLANLSVEEAEKSGETEKLKARLSSTEEDSQVSVPGVKAGDDNVKEPIKNEDPILINNTVIDKETNAPEESFAESEVRLLEELLKRCQVALCRDKADIVLFENGMESLRCGQLEVAKSRFAEVSPGPGSDWTDLNHQISQVQKIVDEANCLLQGLSDIGSSKRTRGGDPLATLALLAPILQETSPRAPHFMMIKARALLAMGELESRIKVLENALELVASQESDTFTKDENCCISSNEVLDCLTRTRTALRHRSRGNDLFRKKNYSMAVKAYDNALKAEDKCATLHYNRATALTALQSHEEAVASCDRALGIFNGHSKAMRRRADGLASLGRHGEALTEYSRLLAISPEDLKLIELVERQRKLCQ